MIDKELRNKLSTLSKEDLINQILQFMDKNQAQAKKINELTKVIATCKADITELNNEIIFLKDNSKSKKIYKNYEDMLRDYRIEISDLKDEIEAWKKRYILKK